MHRQGKQSPGNDGVVSLGIGSQQRGETGRSPDIAPWPADRDESERAYLTSGGLADRSGQRPVGELVVRRERHVDAFVLWLSGVLDRATSALLEREIDARPDLPTRVVIDLTGVAFIDSSGLNTLVRIQRPVAGSAKVLSFRLGRHIARHPLEMVRTIQLRSPSPARHTGPRDEDSYLALAMACADVDHLRPRDRPRGTSPRLPRQAAGTSDAVSLPSVARASPAPTPVRNPRRQPPLHRGRSDRWPNSYIRAVPDAADPPEIAAACARSPSGVNRPEAIVGAREVESRPPAA
jgi:anti-anti-sigma factor